MEGTVNKSHQGHSLARQSLYSQHLFTTPNSLYRFPLTTMPMTETVLDHLFTEQTPLDDFLNIPGIALANPYDC